ncbi:MAG: helix-turn-helix domain-containing protein [bacterium]|nr:helix-turn-helix domain-containing protein [bacterium]
MARNSNLQKGLYVLETMAAEARGFSVAEVANLTGMDRGHACRLLKTLVDRGYVVQDTGSREYRIGLRTLELSSEILSGMGLYRVGQVYIRDLSDRLGVSTYLGVPHLDQVLTIATVYAAGRFEERAPGFGSTMTPHESAMGKVLLAHGLLTSETRLDNTEQADILEEGCALVSKPLDDLPRVVGVAAPVYDHRGTVIAAVGASLTAADWELKDHDAFQHQVRTAGQGLSFALGHAASRVVPQPV